MNNNLDEMLKEAPSLTLEPFAPADTAENSLLPVKEEETRVPEVVLTPQEQKMVDDFAAQIDITNTQAVMQYGAGSQKKIADFSESALNNVRTKDMGEIGQMLRTWSRSLKISARKKRKAFLAFSRKAATSWKA